MARRVKNAANVAHDTSFTHHGTHHGVEEYELKKNGLRVLYRFDDSAPVAGLMVTYLVGSRHEALGHTGATHLLEHLMFKGSKNFPKKDGLSALDKLGTKGALVNASTWFDRTNYYEVLPDEHLEFAVRLEADRMRNAIITQKDFDEEMPAVRSEYAVGENDALESLDKEIWATAYQAHPYHHSTIGWLSDIENVSIEQLQHFYDTFYWPNNAYVTVIGNIERKKALALIKKYFGVHSRSPHPIPVPYTTEPLQRGKRFVEVKRAGTKNVTGIAWKVPEALHADTPALQALAAILAGGSTSRLHRALVEGHLASSVRSVSMPFHDPSLLMMYVTPAEGVPHEKVEQVVQAECRKLVQKGVSKAELGRVIAGIQTEMAFARDGHYAMLSALNEAIATGDWKFFFDLPKKLSLVSVKDVQKAARTYLADESMTVGYYRAIKV